MWAGSEIAACFIFKDSAFDTTRSFGRRLARGASAACCTLGKETVSTFGVGTNTASVR